MILAIDPAIATLGWAVVDPRSCSVVELGVRIARPAEGRPKNDDRLERLDAHADALLAIARRRGCSRLAAEAISLPRAGGIDVAASAFLTWGMLVGIARALDMPRPAQIAPQSWQRAVVPDAAVRKREGYTAIERELAAFVVQGDGAAAEQLRAIAPGNRNHALDAIGVGVFAALHPTAGAAHLGGQHEQQTASRGRGIDDRHARRTERVRG